ncbi:MAG: CHAT domain-containing protein [Egibacteraceae bacterium]
MASQAETGQETPAARAAVALEHARDDPKRARAEATAVLALEGAGPEAVAVAERALGLAARADNDLSASSRHLRRAIRVAERHGLASLAAQARVSLFGTLAFRGDFAAAFREADRAGAGLRGVDRGRLELQRANVLLLQGDRLVEALDGLQRALPLFRRANETSLEATVLENRGLVHSYLGDAKKAEADLLAAEGLRHCLGQQRLAAQAQQNLGFVAARRGDLPAALAWFDRADEFFRLHGVVDSVGLRDRCEALLRARLVSEARAVAEHAVSALAEQGWGIYLAEARVMLAEAALLEGDVATAQAEAGAAARAFARQRRPRHHTLATYLQLKARWRAGERSERLLAAARRAGRTLEEYGWTAPAQDCRLIAGQLAPELGHPIVGRRELRLASRHRRRGPVGLRIGACHARALLRLAEGDRTGAARALRTGMELLERHRALLGATDLRVHASAHTAELAELGLRLAWEDGRAEHVLRWAERWRAGSLVLPPARPPQDRRLQRQLAQLRQVTSEAERAALTGERSSGLMAMQTQLERSIRDLARHATGTGVAPAWAAGGLRALTDTLGDRALVEFVAIDGVLHAVVLTARGTELVELGATARVSDEAEALRFAMRRLAHARGSAASQAAAEVAFDHARNELDDLLLAPIASHIEHRHLVLIPTGALHALPWSALPTCQQRPAVVAPSARLWQRATSAARETTAAGRAVFAAGPDVPAAAAEIRAVASCYPDAVCYTGADARVDDVAQALDGAGLGHLAAHGRFRDDSPLFSSLRLADGPLTVYDLEALDQAPRRLVLSACDSGLSDVRAGDELRGLMAALFTQGTRTVIAPVTPVPDDATRPLMVALHRALSDGTPPAVALAGAQAHSGDDPQARAAAAGFVCFGAG